MGLGFNFPGKTYDSRPSWSYCGFHEFRDRLASAIGVRLKDMYGFGGGCPWSAVNDPIVPLLNHSDCEGKIEPKTCATVAPRLREIVTSWPADYDRANGLLLADAMDACARYGVPLIFC